MKHIIKATKYCTAAFIILAILLTTSCKKSPDLAQHIYDKNYFFTVTINGKSYTTYAWSDRTNPFSDTPIITGVFAIKNDPIIDPWRLYIHFRAPRVQNMQVPGTCSADIFLTKSGDLLGAYSIEKNNFSLFFGIDGNPYSIDRAGSVFNINYLSPPGTEIPVVEGNFQCTLFDPTSKFHYPATGTFRLKVKY